MSSGGKSSKHRKTGNIGHGSSVDKDSRGKKELICETCKRTFSRSDNLQTHQRVHSGEKPFDCKYCGQKFRWIGSMRSHESRHVREGHSVGGKAPKIRKHQVGKRTGREGKEKKLEKGSHVLTLSEEDMIGRIEVDGPWDDVLGD